MKNHRPMNLDLMTMKFPAMAIASILHRLSGIGLFLLFPYILYLLQGSLASRQSFADTITLLHSPLHKALVWVFMAALLYHLLAGIRHLVMDMGWGEQLSTARRSALMTMVMAFILTLIAGVWLW
ncbi:MAG: succinate dehydrogenase, cytochrome b556 subunit [Legionellaceae bacterium]|nr:succinate dehydrogenase, cytochrome b556 subunit [Legionellaceae bacterium]